uniref:PNPLA domain-containing protein n=1 Tax=Oryza brachyantha TaxID=4533 RepID=J3MGU1_ORYBR
MATSSLALLDQTMPFPAAPGGGVAAGGSGSDRLSQEIFSILESNFLFGAPPAEGPGYYSVGRVRVLSIDGGDGGALAAAALVRLERRLKELSGNPDARVADFFDLAAGSGAGGFLAAALFACRMPAEAARDVVAKNRKVFSGRHGRGGLFWRPESVFKKVFGDLTVDQAVSMAFGESRATNYIRIQGNGIAAGATTAEAAMTERSVESVLFRGKKLMAQTNGERLDGVAEQLLREHHRRMESKTPVVLIKPSATPRTSSSSASTLITVSTNASSESP